MRSVKHVNVLERWRLHLYKRESSRDPSRQCERAAWESETMRGSASGVTNRLSKLPVASCTHEQALLGSLCLAEATQKQCNEASLFGSCTISAM